MTSPNHLSRQQRIEKTLSDALSPTYLRVENESNRHSVPAGSETHFKIIAVSALFEPLSRIARHRYINQLLAHELDTGMHALSMYLYTANEWEVAEKGSQKSPACHSKETKKYE